MDQPAKPDPQWSGESPDSARSSAPWRIFNIGNHRPVELMRYIEVLETCLGRKAVLDLQPMQPGDVPATYADVSELTAATGFEPATPVETGVQRFVDWYRSYYK
jgi:UDP-glucuronate 4-epimerase